MCFFISQTSQGQVLRLSILQVPPTETVKLVKFLRKSKGNRGGFNSGSHADVQFMPPLFSDYWAQQSAELRLYPGSVALYDLEQVGP